MSDSDLTVFKQLYTLILAILSCLTNTILLVLIAFAPNQVHIGNYRILLFIFAVTDMIVSVMHAIIIPEIQMGQYGYIFWGLNSIQWQSAMTGRVVTVIFVILFYQTFMLLVYHFVYRYLSIIRGAHWTQGISRRTWIIFAVLFDILYMCAYAAACGAGLEPDDTSVRRYGPIMLQEFGVDLTQHSGYLATIYTEDEVDGIHPVRIRWGTVAAMVTVIGLFSASAAVIVFCTMKIVSALNETAIHDKTRNIQKQLFRALVIQALIPCIFTYIPLCFIFLIPVTGINIGELGSVFILVTAIFPVLDPLLIILLVNRYRNSLSQFFKERVLRLHKNTNSQASSSYGHPTQPIKTISARS